MRKRTAKDDMKEIKGLYEEVSKTSPLPPPFFEEDPKGKVKKTEREGGQIKGDKYTVLDRGFGHNFNDGDEFKPNDFEIIRVSFESPEKVREALRLASEDKDIGIPSYEIGPDGRTLIFHYWKASKRMKERTDRIVKFFKDRGLSMEKESGVSKY